MTALEKNFKIPIGLNTKATEEAHEEEKYFCDKLSVSSSDREGHYLTTTQETERGFTATYTFCTVRYSGTLLLREEPLACVVRHTKRNHLALLQKGGAGTDICRCGWCFHPVSVKCGSSRVPACFPCPGCVAVRVLILD